ncbi:hypothetical protein [Sporomusa sp. KB1]|jgi:hypothetical protein|uniref:hypothetical protein n=1 Tax=Sporomusa sp. KB1 TaxID=943346 RepID=UPI00119D5423|nr:hypothetical protein [Sporomusa sp. KB1]TWH45894.1 hypothetical protein Salpa_1826 [Sporomusa sp. KB1]
MDNQIFGPLELPSGKTISFREGRGRDRANVIQAQKMTIDNMASATLLIDSILAVKCIVEENGVAVNGDYRSMFEDMSSSDLDYYMAVRQELFGMTEERKNKVKEAASFLLSKLTSTDSSKLQSTAMPAATVSG